jgi:DNA primase
MPLAKEIIMSAEFIDFRELRKQLPIEAVLKHYNVQLKISGQRATGFCPLPSHPRRETGKRTASFSVDLKRGLFNCFGCKAGGSVLDLAIRLEGKNPDAAADVRTVALKLVKAFNLDTRSPKHLAKAAKRPAGEANDVESSKPAPVEDAADSDAIINAPLEFTLKLDPEHPYLASRGLLPDTIEHFGLGFCSRGMLKDRIAIPLHNTEGQLVGYAGRLVDDHLIDDEHPKYRFPGSHERNGIRHSFRKGDLLYNFHRVSTPVKDLIVVEGFFSVWWLYQHGYPETVALMGSSSSDAQRQLIIDLLEDDGRLWIMTDGDDAGDALAGELLQHLSKDRWCRRVCLDPRLQPTDLDGEELAGCFAKFLQRE